MRAAPWTGNLTVARGTGRIVKVKVGQPARRVCKAVLSCKPRVATRRAVADVGIHSLVTSSLEASPTVLSHAPMSKEPCLFEHQRTCMSHVQVLAVWCIWIEERISLVNVQCYGYFEVP